MGSKYDNCNSYLETEFTKSKMNYDEPCSQKLNRKLFTENININTFLALERSLELAS